MIPISKSKTMQNIYRTIIWNQEIEILLMTQVVNDIPKLSGLIFDSNRVTELWDGALNKDLITKMSNQTGKKFKIVRKRFIIPMLQDK